MRQKHKQVTLKRKILFTMVALVIFQIIAIPGVLLLIGTPSKLDASNIETH